MKKYENAFILYKFFLLITINFSNVKISILFLSYGRIYCNIIDKLRDTKTLTKKNIKVEFYMIKLNNKIKVVVPKENNDGKAINCSIIKRSIATVTDVLGGATTYDGTGQWIASNGHLMTDKVSVTEWSYDLVKLLEDDKLRHTACFISWTVDSLIAFHGQEAVSIERDGVLYIIEKNDILCNDGTTDSIKTTDLVEKIMKGDI